MRLEFILLFVALAVIAYQLHHQEPITLSLDLKNPLTPEETTLTAKAKTDIGPLKLSCTASWGAPRGTSSKLSFDLELPFPRKLPWVEIQFTTDSLSGILVSRGDWVQEGQLIGFHSVAIKEEIAQLEAKMAVTQDELIRAEIEAKLQELRQQNEVRSLVAGKVQSLWVEQLEQELVVHLKVVQGGGGGTQPEGGG